MELVKGKLLGNRYRIDEFLGRGGMAEVYKVWDTQRGVALAMKVLQDDLAEDIVFMRRFEREAHNLTKLQHPNIVRCYGLEREGRTAFMLMDYIDGWTLRTEIFDAHAPLTMQRILEVMQPVCSALNYAHQMGVVHCDVKSANIMIHKNGTVYLTDFGIARGMDAATSTMVGIGTPAYMAPELIKGQDPTPQTDIYALGIVLYEMLTGGERPFTGERAEITGTTAEKVRWEHLYKEPIPLAHFVRNVPPQVNDLVMQCLAKDPVRRFKNITSFASGMQNSIGKNLDNSYHKRSTIANVKLPTSNDHSSQRSHNEFRRGTAERKLNPIWIGSLILVIVVLFISLTKEGTSRNNSRDSWNPTMTHMSLQDESQDSDDSTEYMSFATEAVDSFSDSSTWEPEAASSWGIGSTMISSKDEMTMVYVPEGEFIMGSDDGYDDEKPVHSVWLDAFWIDQTEVTNGMYEKCVAEKICDPQDNHAYTNPDTGTQHFNSSAYSDYPAVYVNWEQASNYCAWAGKRLPTEAEWEKAAKGDTSYSYPWGNSFPNSNLANFNDTIGDTVEVGSYPDGASMYGALDMVGNVFEWVSDWYDGNYYSESDSINPLGPMDGETHVLRGGSFFSDAKYSRVTYRESPSDSRTEDYGSGNWGFRCAMDAE